jgi:hypothetical protein
MDVKKKLFLRSSSKDGAKIEINHHKNDLKPKNVIKSLNNNLKDYSEVRLKTLSEKNFKLTKLLNKK